MSQFNILAIMSLSLSLLLDSVVNSQIQAFVSFYQLLTLKALASVNSRWYFVKIHFNTLVGLKRLLELIEQFFWILLFAVLFLRLLFGVSYKIAVFLSVCPSNGPGLFSGMAH